MEGDFKDITDSARKAVEEIIEAAGLTPGSLFVVGCSSSEVLGNKIGTATNTDIANAIYDGIAPLLTERGIALAAQCCEHLNRALVVEESVMKELRLERVNAIPQPNHAGGAWATVCYERFSHPVLVEDIHALADAGIDIGGTMIGMHIHPVVVPLRVCVTKIGEASILCARRRPKYVGGQRAIYDERLM